MAKKGFHKLLGRDIKAAVVRQAIDISKSPFRQVVSYLDFTSK